MKINYTETIINNYDENNELIGTQTIRTPILIPEENEAIQNKVNGHVYFGVVGLGTDDSIDNYEAIVIEGQI